MTGRYFATRAALTCASYHDAVITSSDVLENKGNILRFFSSWQECYLPIIHSELAVNRHAVHMVINKSC